MSEKQEVEGWAEVNEIDGHTYASSEPGYTQDGDQQLCMITPKPLWDQRREALRVALAAAEIGECQCPISPMLCVHADALVKLRALPGMKEAEGG